MNLTDEQRDEILEALECAEGGIYSEFGLEKIRKNGREWLQALLNSEQAWKEEVERYQKQLNEARKSLRKIVENPASTGEDALEMHMEAEYALLTLSQGTEEANETI